MARRRPTPAALAATALAALAVLGCALPAAGATAVPVAGPAGGPASSGSAGSTGRYVVVLRAGTRPDVVAAAARAAGARVVATQPAVGSLVVDAAPSAARALRAVPGVRWVSADRALQPMSLGTDSAGEKGSMALVADAVHARDLWARGITGDGVGVALLDTGVAPVPGLLGADKVVVGPDLSFESQNRRLRNLDTYGHGTNMAGIIAGREGPRATGAEYVDDPGFHGIAPDATLVSLKLADHYGAVDVSQVIAAIDWVVQHRDDTGVPIRVINLSFGTPSQQAPWEDPLGYAAEVATRYGILVVAAAGNNGANGYGLNDPAYNRNVLAVGATNTAGTPQVDDDRIPWFSARRGGAAWWRSPDVVAPGAGIVSLRVPGSYIADTYPKAAVGALGMRGSGTSQAAAVVSGAAALLLQQRPWLDPAELRWLFKTTAQPLRGEGRDAAGAGSIDVAAAATTWWVGSDSTSWGSGRGTLEAARGGIHVSDGDVALTGERDVQGSPWSPDTAWPTATASMWTADGQWNGAFWIGPGFAPDPGPDGSWSGRTWAGRTWAGRTWSGRTWSGRTWSDARWDGAGWTASAWPEPQEDDGLAAKRWGTASWDAR